MKNSLLTPEEMVFLRKMLRRKQGEMAELLGVNQVQLNRWERGTRRGRTKAADTLFRLIYVTLQDDEYTHEASQNVRNALLRYFGHIKAKAAP